MATLTSSNGSKVTRSKSYKSVWGVFCLSQAEIVTLSVWKHLREDLTGTDFIVRI